MKLGISYDTALFLEICRLSFWRTNYSLWIFTGYSECGSIERKKKKGRIAKRIILSDFRNRGNCMGQRDGEQSQISTAGKKKESRAGCIFGKDKGIYAYITREADRDRSSLSLVGCQRGMEQ